MTLPNIEFTPTPTREYAELYEQHATLTAYIEREAPELRAAGKLAALEVLEHVAAQLLDRLNKMRTGS